MEVQTFDSKILQNNAWAMGLHCTHTDGTPFNFTSGVTTAQIRSLASQTDTPLVMITVTIAIPTSGDIVLGLCGFDTGSLPITTAKTFVVAPSLFLEVDFFPTADPLNSIRVATSRPRVVPGGNTRPARAPAPTVALETINLVVGGASPATARALLGISPAQLAYASLMLE